MKIDNFQGQLTDISAKKEALPMYRLGHPQHYSFLSQNNSFQG